MTAPHFERPDTDHDRGDRPRPPVTERPQPGVRLGGMLLGQLVLGQARPRPAIE
ncbi:hypothetical protein [Nocardia sp. NPDC050710]|uniref:hypothetical protein n=1 Tax=Nocardia sp. NPDC050710 TaxID=3157220 RepID=UPI0033D46CB6